MKKVSVSLGFSLAALAFPALALALVAGDLIKASGPAVYYRAEDGKRYVFPTEKTYKSWYANFSAVKTISDAELADIGIGGNVTYRPGVKLLKITTDPKVYAVDGRTLRWVKTEVLAKQLYGDDWAKQVEDLPDPFFINYSTGPEIATSSDYAPTAIRDAYPTIQVTLTGATGTPAPTPAPTPTPTPTSTGISVTVTTDKPTAQANETIEILAQTTYSNGIDRLELYIDGALYRTCLSLKSCSTSWVVPVAGTKASYTYRAKLTTTSGQTAEATTSTVIVTLPYHSSVTMTADRTTIRPNQQPSLRSLVTQGLTAQKNEIYIDGLAMKVCTATSSATNANDCRYTDYISGTLGSTHTAYAIVTTAAGLKYKGNTLVVTIGSNDTPAVTFTAAKSQIYVGETVDITLSASDDDGLKGTEILKDGISLKSCLGAVPCTVTTGPWNVPSGTVLTFEGRAYDMLSATATAMTTVTVK